MTSTDDLPRFSSARGTVGEWFDLDRSYRAFAHYKRIRYEVEMVIRRAAHPDWDERSIHGNPPPSPEMPIVWEFEELVHEVRVLPPDREFTRVFRPHEGHLILAGTRTITPSRTTMRGELRVGEGITQEYTRPTKWWRRDDLDAYCYGPHDREALALLQPRCFFHGREPIWATPVATTFLGRPADVTRLRRMIPLTDPRILGDQFNPTVFDEAEETEVIVDLERGVVLEWRGLFDGAPYERHFFTEIAFDAPMAPEDFDREVGPEH